MNITTNATTNADTTDLRSQILERVTDAEGIDSEELAEFLGRSHKEVDDMVAEMCADGTLAPCGGD